MERLQSGRRVLLEVVVGNERKINYQLISNRRRGVRYPIETLENEESESDISLKRKNRDARWKKCLRTVLPPQLSPDGVTTFSSISLYQRGNERPRAHQDAHTHQGVTGLTNGDFSVFGSVTDTPHTDRPFSHVRPPEQVFERSSSSFLCDSLMVMDQF